MPENAAEKLALAAKPTPRIFHLCLSPRGRPPRAADQDVPSMTTPAKMN
jgi:hypothetical protein